MFVFYAIVGIIVAAIAAFIFKIACPMWKFMSRAKCAKELCQGFYEFFAKKSTAIEETSQSIIVNGTEIKMEEIQGITFENGMYSITLDKTKTKKDIMQELKDIINDALSYSEPLEYLMIIDEDLKKSKTELIEMCSNIGMLQWHSS